MNEPVCPSCGDSLDNGYIRVRGTAYISATDGATALVAAVDDNGYMSDFDYSDIERDDEPRDVDVSDFEHDGHMECCSCGDDFDELIERRDWCKYNDEPYDDDEDDDEDDDSEGAGISFSARTTAAVKPSVTWGGSAKRVPAGQVNS